jgi:hypothetical protein
VVAACGGRAHPASVATGDEVTLYRDHALVAQRVELDAPATETAIVKLTVAAGVTTEDIALVDHGGVSIRKIQVVGRDARVTDEPTELEIVFATRNPGHFVVHVAYATDRLKWDAGYTMTTNPSRDRATLRGAVAIRNTMGIALRRAQVYVIDAELGAWRGRVAERMAGALVGANESTTPMPEPRQLGTLDLPVGETRVEMLGGDPPRRMRSVLVYDPIGTRLDNPSGQPLRDAALGVSPPASPRVTESFEVVRNEHASIGLPAGPVRLLARKPDGTLAVLGEGRLFEPSTRVANVDTIPIGTADGVTGHRERRELTIDDDAKRIVEEFAITIDNTRAYPLDVVFREHLYRGQNWTIAYSSVVLTEKDKEGAQQFSLHTTVPAKGKTTIMYVVVYQQ